MESKKLENLSVHVTQITSSLIQQIDSEGIIRTFLPDGSVLPDIVASHHLIELLCGYDKKLFTYFIETMLSWMTNPERGIIDEPFTVDSIASIVSVSEKSTNFLRDTI